PMAPTDSVMPATSGPSPSAVTESNSGPALSVSPAPVRSVPPAPTSRRTAPAATGRRSEHEPAQGGRTHEPRSPVPPLPELAALGIGVIGATALARRLRRIRRSADSGYEGDAQSPDHSDGAVDVATLIGQFA